MILPEDDWKKIHNDLRNWLKQHPLLSQNSDKRGMIYEKLPELNRIAFSTAYKKFCSDYSLNMQDLWPVVGNKDGISLSAIRNKIVHGETFQSIHYKPIVIATYHLQWIVERMILAILGWDINQSEVSESKLSKGMTKDQIWKTDLKFLSDSLK